MTSATRRPDAPGAIEGAAETAASVGRYKGLMARGISEADIVQMSQTNPAKLLGLKP